jgi:hypothetical protein
VSVIEAAIRPDEWNLALFVHVLSAMVLIGALVLALTALVSTWRGGPVAMTRLGMRALLWVALPSWVVMRVSAQWILDEEGYGDESPNWIDIGFMTSEPTFLLLIVATVLTALGVRRASAAGEGALTRDRTATVLVAITLVAYVFAIWAMTTKPM